MIIIGFTGKRHVGKSEAAAFLAAEGFVRAHAFEPGKVMAVAYFEHLGASHDIALAMVYGELRDIPSPLLPGGVTPRFFLERFGNFMGVTLGPEWTLGVELRRQRQAQPGKNIVIESVVYEADTLRQSGGMIVRIVRPGSAGPAGMMTDAAESSITADVTIVNDGSLEDLRRKVQDLAKSQ